MIHNKDVVKEVRRLGIHPRKTFTATVNQEFQYDKDFWRGMIDGDGCLLRHKDTCTIVLSGNKSICDSFSKYIEQITGVRYKTHKIKNENAHKIVISSRSVVLAMLKNLYIKSECYLDRKYNKALEMIDFIESKYSNPEKKGDKRAGVK